MNLSEWMQRQLRLHRQYRMAIRQGLIAGERRSIDLEAALRDRELIQIKEEVKNGKSGTGR